MVSINGVEYYGSSELLLFMPPISLVPSAYSFVVGGEQVIVVEGSALSGLPSSPSLYLRCVFQFASSSLLSWASVLTNESLACMLPLPPVQLGASPVVASLVVMTGLGALLGFLSGFVPILGSVSISTARSLMRAI